MRESVAKRNQAVIDYLLNLHVIVAVVFHVQQAFQKPKFKSDVFQKTGGFVGFEFIVWHGLIVIEKRAHFFDLSVCKRVHRRGV